MTEPLNEIIKMLNEGHGACYSKRVVQVKYGLSPKYISKLCLASEYTEAVKKKNREKQLRHGKFLISKRV